MEKEDIKTFYDHGNHVSINYNTYYTARATVNFFLGGMVLGGMAGAVLGILCLMLIS